MVRSASWQRQRCQARVSNHLEIPFPSFETLREAARLLRMRFHWLKHNNLMLG